MAEFEEIVKEIVTPADVDAAWQQVEQHPEGTAEKREALGAYMELRDRVRGEAVARGIAAGQEDARRVYPNAPDITEHERAAIAWIATWPALHLDDLEQIDGLGPVPEAVKAGMVERFADTLASAPLWRKALAAANLEYAVLNDDPPLDGVLGRALDEVIATLAPYSKGRS